MKTKKKLKKWQIVLIAFVAIGIIGALVSPSKKTEGDNSKPKTEETKPDNTKKEDSKKNETPTYRVGDVVKVGDVEYTVNSITSEKTIGSEYVNKTAQETFLIVNISIKNNGNKALTVSDSFFKLKNGEKEFSADSGSAIYLTDESVIFKEINPDATLTGSFLFDVTQATIDSADLQLQVQTGAWGTEKGLINLH